MSFWQMLTLDTTIGFRSKRVKQKIRSVAQKANKNSDRGLNGKKRYLSLKTLSSRVNLGRIQISLQLIKVSASLHLMRSVSRFPKLNKKPGKDLEIFTLMVMFSLMV